MASIAMWWFRRPNGAPNFGDELGPEIVRRLGFDVRRVPVADAEMVACGSVLHALTNPRTVVWGAGTLAPNRLPRIRLENVRAVRGRVTRELLGLGDVALGDPGLLVSRLWPRPAVRRGIGWVPHYVDERRPGWADRVIDVGAPVDQVVREIASCAAVASSSLHGLIVAQAFGVPTMRLTHSSVVGGEHKWTDFISAIDRPIGAIQNSLLEAFP